MLFFQLAAMPWWATVIGVVTGIALGLLGALPWRSTAQAATAAAEAANTERDTLRETRNRLTEEVTQLKAEIAVLKAKTDLDGLRAEMIKSMQDMRDEFKHHSDQDLTTATQQITAIEAVKASLELLRSQRG